MVVAGYKGYDMANEGFCDKPWLASGRGTWSFGVLSGIKRVYGGTKGCFLVLGVMGSVGEWGGMDLVGRWGCVWGGCVGVIGVMRCCRREILAVWFGSHGEFFVLSVSTWLGLIIGLSGGVSHSMIVLESFRVCAVMLAGNGFSCRWCFEA